MPIQRIMQRLRAKLQSLSGSGFLRAVGVLAGGTALAQALSVLALPLVARLYTPAEFSVLAVYSSILAITSVAACLRLEIAIPLPARDEEAANLLALALCVCTVVSVVAVLAVWWFPTQIVSLVGQPGLRPFLWMVPLGIWLASVYSALQFWATRKKKFGTIAKTRMTQALGGTGAQVGLGWSTGLGAFGLLLGQMISSGAGVFGLGIAALRDHLTVLRSVSRSGMRRALRDYDRFPKYSTFEAFANNAGIQLPVIIIAATAIGPDAGYLLLATRVLAIPISLIGAAVSQVYLSRASDEMREGRLAAVTAQIIGGMIKSGIGPLVFVGIVAPVAFPLIFGNDWHRAGELVVWMTPWFVMQFLASPISMALHVIQAQRIALNLTLAGLVLRVGGVAAAAFATPDWIIQVYAISSFLYYGIYFYVVMEKVKIPVKELFSIIRENINIISGWIALAILSRLFISMIL